MSGSLASRTAAMIDAAITSVEAKRSVIRFCSAIALVRSCSSLAMARLISPMYHRRFVTCEGFANRSCESRPWKMSAGKYRRLAPQRGQSAMIQESGMVWTGAGNVLLAALADYDKRMDAGRWAVEHENSIGEYKAKISTLKTTAVNSRTITINIMCTIPGTLNWLVPNFRFLEIQSPCSVATSTPPLRSLQSNSTSSSGSMGVPSRTDPFHV